MHCGRATGSAMPLVWAHAEYIRLLRSARSRAVFDAIEPVYRRYVEQGVKSDLQVWLFNHKLRAALSSRPLRIEASAPARLHWTANEWVTAQDTELLDEGLDSMLRIRAGRIRVGRGLEVHLLLAGSGALEGRDFSIAIQ